MLAVRAEHPRPRPGMHTYKRTTSDVSFGTESARTQDNTPRINRPANLTAHSTRRGGRPEHLNAEGAQTEFEKFERDANIRKFSAGRAANNRKKRNRRFEIDGAEGWRGFIRLDAAWKGPRAKIYVGGGGPSLRSVFIATRCFDRIANEGRWRSTTEGARGGVIGRERTNFRCGAPEKSKPPQMLKQFEFWLIEIIVLPCEENDRGGFENCT